MDYLPLFYKVKNRQVLLVGGGKVALRKANFLLRAQAKIKLVAIEVCAELEELLADKKHEVSSRAFQNGDINEASLIVAATNNIELNKQKRKVIYEKNNAYSNCIYYYFWCATTNIQ